MNKEAYLQKLQATKFTDENTVAEMKIAQKNEKALRRWWIKQVKNSLKLQGIDIEANIVGWTSYKYIFDLKPTGTIVVEETHMSDHHSTRGRTILIKKGDIFSSTLRFTSV